MPLAATYENRHRRAPPCTPDNSRRVFVMFSGRVHALRALFLRPTGGHIGVFWILARGLGAASRASVARLRRAQSDARGMSSTRSTTVGAARQVRGGAEAGFWVVLIQTQPLSTFRPASTFRPRAFGCSLPVRTCKCNPPLSTFRPCFA